MQYTAESLAQPVAAVARVYLAATAPTPSASATVSASAPPSASASASVSAPASASSSSAASVSASATASVSAAVWACGASAATAGASCAAIYAACGVTDALLWIAPAGAPYLAACRDGVWTLALQADGSSSTLAYDAPYWTSGSLLNGDVAALSPSGGDALLQPYVDVGGSRVRIVMSVGGVEGAPLDLDFPPFASLRALLAPGVEVDTAAPLTSWYGLLASGEAHEDNCNLQGANVAVADPIFADWSWWCANPAWRFGIIYNDGELRLQVS